MGVLLSPVTRKCIPATRNELILLPRAIFIYAQSAKRFEQPPIRGIRKQILDPGS